MNLYMDETRLRQILKQFPEVSILVIGDFFLDNYLILERELSEISLETGLEAYQVVARRKSPGAAGTVTANLRALDVNVLALGLTGADGNGYELREKLVEIKVDIHALIKCPGRFTPTYNKPMMREPDGRQHELNRMDIKNRSPLPSDVEHDIIKHMHEMLPEVQGVLIADQIQERNCGVITDKVREEIHKLALTNPRKFFIADSRWHAGLFHEVILKTNLSEAMNAAEGAARSSVVDQNEIYACCQELYKRSQRPILITRGDRGCILFNNPESHMVEIPAVPVEGPIDIVGAGDSFLTGMGSSLCAGAGFEEAALIGNLAASIVIQQIGTTGTASRAQIIERFREFGAISIS
jgi:rfaE bifunctional protein kinase chain/domain